jgi:asparagine synthase (glutamine-hydrolysing)
MCGIIGIAGGNPNLEELKAMLTQIRHRGPDGEGVHLAEGVGIGNVRLAIVDLSPAGDQPMLSPDGRYSLVYNGELYNHMDFRPQLEASGVRFRGHSDTETLLWLLIRHGEAILPELNGIFTFAFHDSLTGNLLLARDHMGVKSLYYARGKGGRLLFASEIKALFVTGEVEPRLNVDDILELFMYHFIAGERTAFANVYELPAGHMMQVADGRMRLKEFWNVTSTAQAGSAEGEADPFDSILDAAVRRQLMADVPIGIMSSGGLDSGIVTALAGRQNTQMTGFCFRDPAYGYDEFEEARSASTPFNVNVEEVRIPEVAVPDLLATLTWHYDEPLPRPHHIAAYAVSKRAQETGLKVLLAGEGGDELLGGYTRYITFADEMSRSGDTSPLVFAHNRVALPRIARFWPGKRFLNGYRFWCAEETKGLDLINRQLIVDQKTFLQHFLQRSDRMGMAAGVEIRVPLLDIPLVTYVNGLPGSKKISGGITKTCLRSAARGLLPPALVERPKQPFDMPMAPLLQKGPVADFLDDMLLSKPRCADLFDADGIGSLVRDLRAGQDELWKVTWLLLTTEIWMRTFEVTV